MTSYIPENIYDMLYNIFDVILKQLKFCLHNQLCNFPYISIYVCVHLVYIRCFTTYLFIFVFISCICPPFNKSM